MYILCFDLKIQKYYLMETNLWLVRCFFNKVSHSYWDECGERVHVSGQQPN